MRGSRRGRLVGVGVLALAALAALEALAALAV